MQAYQSLFESDVAPRLEAMPFGCWLWRGPHNSDGYGRVLIGEGHRTTGVHRVVYTHLIGDIPEGLFPDHLCRVRDCANPTHLELVTNAENLRRGRAARPRLSKMWVPLTSEVLPDTCKHGHSYAPETTGAYRNGTRRCRTCQKGYWNAYTRRQRDKALGAPVESFLRESA